MTQEQINQLLERPAVHFLISVLISFLLGLVIASTLTAIGKRSKKKLIKSSAQRLRGIVFVFCVIIGVKFGLQAFDLTPETSQQIGNGITFALFMLATWSMTLIYDAIHEEVILPWGQREDNVTLVDVGRTVVQVLIWLLGVVSGLSSAGFNVYAVISGLGIGGLALALAAQDAVANIFGGIIILTQRPFKVGDKITVNGITGWATSIGIRSTIIYNWYGQKVVVPNKSFTDSAVTNVDERKEYWENIQLKLRHDTPVENIEKAVQIVRDILGAHDDLREANWVGVCGIGEGFVEIEVWYGIIRWEAADTEKYVNEYTKLLGVKHDVHLEVLRRLEKAAIQIAVPIQGRVNYNAGEQQSRFLGPPPMVGGPGQAAS